MRRVVNLPSFPWLGFFEYADCTGSLALLADIVPLSARQATDLEVAARLASTLRPLDLCSCMVHDDSEKDAKTCEHGSHRILASYI